MNVSTVTSCTVGKISVLPASDVQGKKNESDCKNNELFLDDNIEGGKKDFIP